MISEGAAGLANRLYLRACSVLAPAEWDGCGPELRKLDRQAWDGVAAHATRHGFVGLLARNLGWAQERLDVAIPILGKLDADRRGQLLQHMARRNLARRYASGLQERAIPFVIFKGIVLAEEVYGDLSLRGFRDCDVMVPRARLDEAYDLALAQGYRLTQFAHPHEYAQLGAHAAGMVHPDGGGLDLHWSIAPDLLGDDKVELVWRHCVAAPEGATLPGLRLSPEMTLIHLAKHFHSHQYGSLKPLLDFHVASRRLPIDPQRLVPAAEGLGLLQVVDITARVCERRFVGADPALVLGGRAASFQARLATRVLGENLLLDPEESSRLGNWLRFLVVPGSAGALWRALVEALVPGRLTLAQMFGREQGVWVYPRYYWHQLVKVVTLSRR